MAVRRGPISRARSFIVDLVTQVNSLKPALAVMGRAPLAGRVKTRLCPPFDPEQAAEFYECVLRDVLHELAPSTRWDTWVAYAERSRDYFQRLPEPGIGLLPQRGASLGERMHAVFTDLFHVGYRQVLVVGSDIVTLRAASVREACEVLERNRCDLVLGPADDGGYYLIGLNGPEEGLFSGMVWSTASVLEDSLARARQLELRVRMVARTYDVDVVEDLERLRRDFECSRTLRGRRPRTHAWISRRFPRADAR